MNLQPLRAFLLVGLSAGLCPGQDPPPPLPPEFSELEKQHQKERAAALRGVLAKYADDLERLENQLTGSGDLKGAARVRMERDRILPVLGLPMAEEAGADDFSLFEEEPELGPSTAPLPAAGELDALIQSLLAPSQPAGPSGSEGNASPSSPAPVPRRILRMAGAQLVGSYDPVYGYVYWTSNRTALWTVADLPPGQYEIVLRYACDARNGGGGKVEVSFGTGKLEGEVPPTGGWKRRKELVLGPFEIRQPRADLKFTAKPSGSYLMDLAGVIIRPAVPRPPTVKP